MGKDGSSSASPRNHVSVWLALTSWVSDSFLAQTRETRASLFMLMVL